MPFEIAAGEELIFQLDYYVPVGETAQDVQFFFDCGDSLKTIKLEYVAHCDF